MASSQTNTMRIQRTSRRLIRVLMMLMVAVPTIVAGIWLFLNDLPPVIQHELLPEFARPPLPVSARWMGFGVTLIPLCLFFYANAVLIRLFRLYEAGRIFDEANVACYRLLSRLLIAWFAACVLTDPMMSIALTLHHPAGERILAVGLESPDITALLIGIILAVISRVMDEGRQMKEEQSLTV